MKMTSARRTASAQVRRERQALLGAVAPDELLEPRLVDRNLAAVAACAIFAASLSTQMTSLPVSAKHAPTTKPDVARADHRNLHERAISSELKLLTVARSSKTCQSIDSIRSCADRARPACARDSIRRASRRADPARLSAGAPPADRRRRIRPRARARAGATAPARRDADALLVVLEGPAGRRTSSRAPRSSIGAFPVALLNFAWHRLGWPPVERLAGAAFDVVHAAHPLLDSRARRRAVVTIHDLDFLDHPERTRARDPARLPGARRRARAPRRSGRRRSRSTRRATSRRRLGVPPSRISVCSPGAPAWPRARRASRRDGCILFLGTLEPRKNLGVLLDAYERLLARMPAAPPLVLAGGRRHRADADRRRASPAAARRPRRAAGLRRRRPIGAALYRRALVFVMPSHTEGFGMPVARSDDDRRAGHRRQPRRAARGRRRRRTAGRSGRRRRARARALRAVARRSASRATAMRDAGWRAGARSSRGRDTARRRARRPGRGRVEHRQERAVAERAAAHRRRRARTRRAADRRRPLPARDPARVGARTRAVRHQRHGLRRRASSAARSCARTARSSGRRAAAPTAGTWWEQTTLAARRRARRRRRASSRPATRRRFGCACPLVVAIHDVSFFAHPEWFGVARGLAPALADATRPRDARARVVTISEFSAGEIVRWLGVPPRPHRARAAGRAAARRRRRGDAPRRRSCSSSARSSIAGAFPS